MRSKLYLLPAEHLDEPCFSAVEQVVTLRAGPFKNRTEADDPGEASVESKRTQHGGIVTVDELTRLQDHTSDKKWREIGALDDERGQVVSCDLGISIFDALEICDLTGPASDELPQFGVREGSATLSRNSVIVRPERPRAVR